MSSVGHGHEPAVLTAERSALAAEQNWVTPVRASLAYLLPMAERPYNYMYEPPAGSAWSNCRYDMHEVSISDARRHGSGPSLEQEGFGLWDVPVGKVNFSDEDEIRSSYYRLVAELALVATGASSAVVFDHLVRRRTPGRPPLSFGRTGDGSSPSPVGRIHNDYTEESGQRRKRLVLNEAGHAADPRRYAIVNVWRPLKGPVLDTPLGLCDARTVNVSELVASDAIYPTRTGEIYLLTHSSNHRWSYFSAMTVDEALVFKQYDSQASGTSRFTPHAAFDLPTIPPKAVLRESIEARCLVVFE